MTNAKNFLNSKCRSLSGTNKTVVGNFLLLGGTIYTEVVRMECHGRGYPRGDYLPGRGQSLGFYNISITRSKTFDDDFSILRSMGISRLLYLYLDLVMCCLL